ncbi:HlyD family secretion protein [Aquirhabdus sp.]|uniref:HlyD family secretion protein n=1 Tax=Aquirhabdus sp. TaxID=2824160 RepID=UPI00396C4D58
MNTDAPTEIKQNWVGRNRLFLMIGVPVILIIIGLYLYLTGGRYVSTDDAYVSAARASVSTNVSARVSEILVSDNQFVHKGDVLFKLDNRAFVIAEREAEAQLATARLQIDSTKASYQQKLAGFKSAEDNLAYQKREYARQQKLAAAGISSQAQLDKTLQDLQTAEQQIQAEKQGADTVLANLGGNANLHSDDSPSVQAAVAALDRAKLNLSYTNITAPIDGVVTKVEQLQVGDYVAAATPVFSLVSKSNVWVEANFKETDLTHMRVGQDVSIDVDAYGSKALTGKVVSISPGTGSTFSLLPPENSTGNWVKIVQRLPVRISINNVDNLALHSGLSAIAKVDTQYHRSLFGSH